MKNYDIYNKFSVNYYKAKQYSDFLKKARTRAVTVDDIIHFGYKLMKKYKLHAHFFADNSLLSTAKYLVDYGLANINEYQNEGVLTQAVIYKIFTLFEQRIAQRIPVEYITKEAEYLGFKYYVNEHVLVPRSIMNTRFIDFLNNMTWYNHRVLDLCTGSGCIGLTLALLESSIKVDLADISLEALEVAQSNIHRYNLSHRVHCVNTNLFDSIIGKYDLIISNPPYVSSDEYQKIPEEFKAEPKIALEAGKDGLDIVHRMLAQAKQYLNPNGVLIVEVGFSAAKRIKKQYPHIHFEWFKYRKPNGRVSLFSMDGVFLCRYADLP